MGLIRKMGTGFLVGPVAIGQGVEVYTEREEIQTRFKEGNFTVRVVKHWHSPERW